MLDGTAPLCFILRAAQRASDGDHLRSPVIMRVGTLLALLVTSLATVATTPQHTGAQTNATIPGSIEAETTFECAGFRWFVEGDSNLTCVVNVAYRETGAHQWSPAQPLLRVEPGSFNDYGIDPGNLLAGSIFHLNPDRSYDVRLSLSDADGGAVVESLVVRTRRVPSADPDARIRYVIPGDGGGSGTEGDPFRGLRHADANAQPGDLFLIAPGIYPDSIQFTSSGTSEHPIVWRGLDRDSTVLDGASTAYSVVRFDSTRHVHVENLTIRRPKNKAVLGLATEGIVIRSCHLDCSVRSGSEIYGIDFRGPGHRNTFVAGNTIEGHIPWEDGRVEDAYAVVISGSGHVIRRNEIFNWFDGMNIGGNEVMLTNLGCDVYGNEVYNCTDDGIETDKCMHNIRIFENRFTNNLCGVSAQPVFGGPIYIIRNVVYNLSAQGAQVPCVAHRHHLLPEHARLRGSPRLGRRTMAQHNPEEQHHYRRQHDKREWRSDRHSNERASSRSRLRWLVSGASGKIRGVQFAPLRNAGGVPYRNRTGRPWTSHGHQLLRRCRRADLGILLGREWVLPRLRPRKPGPASPFKFGGRGCGGDAEQCE